MTKRCVGWCDSGLLPSLDLTLESQKSTYAILGIFLVALWELPSLHTKSFCLNA